jgi:hypothetical protein
VLVSNTEVGKKSPLEGLTASDQCITYQQYLTNLPLQSESKSHGFPFFHIDPTVVLLTINLTTPDKVAEVRCPSHTHSLSIDTNSYQRSKAHDSSASLLLSYSGV